MCEERKNQTKTHNAIYKAKLQYLRNRFPDATISYLDYWSAYQTVLNNPEGYGFRETFKACCGSGEPPYYFDVFTVCGMPGARACENQSRYINWDGVQLNMFLNGAYSQPPFENKLHQG